MFDLPMKTKRRVVIVVVVAGGALAMACGKKDDGDASTASAISGDACRWPDTVRSFGSDPQANDGRCVAAHAFLDCSYDTGSGASCLSDDLTPCDTSKASGLGNLVGCKNLCTANEYAVSCSSEGPPPNCRAAVIPPGGPREFCCPCEP